MKTAEGGGQVMDPANKQYKYKGPSKNYVTPRGGRGSTILLHIVTYIMRGGGVFYEIVT